MPRYIDADKLQPDTSVFLSVYAEQPVKVYSQERIDNAPTEDVAPVRHGRWVKEKRDVLIHWHCSACRECYFLDVPNAKYCPHCGCKMDMDGGEQE